jgi:ERCC4-type nuclease
MTNASLRVVLDIREHKLIQEALKSSVLGSAVITESLPVSDIQIHLNDQVMFAFERKTLCDLVQSVKDGRYREQKLRLLSTYGLDRVIYILEGTPPVLAAKLTESRPDEKITVGCIVNMLCRDGIRLIFTKDVNDTCAFIEQLYTRINDKPSVYAAAAWGPSEGASVSHYVNNALSPREKRQSESRNMFPVSARANTGSIHCKSKTTCRALWNKQYGVFD